MSDARRAGPSAVRRSGGLAQGLFLIGLLVAGIALAFVWRLLTPAAAHLGDDEAGASVDGTLALVALLFGVITGAFVLWRPSRAPVGRTVLAIAGSGLGSVIAWQLGDQLGSPHLRATGAVVVWPAVTALVILVGALLPVTSNRLPSHSDRPAPGAAEEGWGPGFSPGDPGALGWGTRLPPPDRYPPGDHPAPRPGH